MNVAATSNNAVQGSGSDASSMPPTQDTDQMFLQLLMAQLKSQSPLDPVDPNQFVGQLVQFNTLDQLIAIRQLVQQAVDGNSSTQSTQGAN